MSRGQKQLLNAALRRRARQAEEAASKVRAASKPTPEEKTDNKPAADLAPELTVEEEQPVVAPDILDLEDSEPIAGPIVKLADQDDKLTAKLDEVNMIDVPLKKTASEVRDDNDTSNKVGPRTDIPRHNQSSYAPPANFDSDLTELAEAHDILRRMFGKVQIGQVCIVLSQSIEDKSDESIISDVQQLFEHEDVDVKVVKGTREGRYRVVAQ